jgi:hypothetical protein
MQAQKHPILNLHGNIRRANAPSFQPAAKVFCHSSGVANSRRDIFERLEMITEISPNYAELIAGHPAADSVTKDAWFHRWFRSQHGSKTTPPFTYRPPSRMRIPLFPFFTIKNSLPNCA